MFCAQYPSEFQFAPHALPRLAVCPSAAHSPSSNAKVPRAFAWLATRPSAVGVRFCAVASHRTSSPRSRLRRHRLACSVAKCYQVVAHRSIRLGERNRRAYTTSSSTNQRVFRGNCEQSSISRFHQTIRPANQKAPRTYNDDPEQHLHNAAHRQ